MQNLNEVLTFVLKSLEGVPEDKFEEVLIEMLSQQGLNAEDIANVTEAFVLLDNIHEKVQMINEGRERGMSRKTFILNELEQITSGKADDEIQEIIDAVDSAFITESTNIPNN